jgi:hypothetical protein
MVSPRCSPSTVIHGSRRQRQWARFSLRLCALRGSCLGIQPTICPPHRPDKNCYVERLHRTYKYECLLVHRPATVQEVREVTTTFMQHDNSERPHQGRSCQNVPPRVAFPTLPVLPPVPARVDPDRWLQGLHGRAFARLVRSDGTVTVDDVRSYVKHDLAGQLINLFVDATEHVFEVWHAGRPLKQLPLKGLYGQILSFEAYVRLMRQEAHSQGHRPTVTYHSLQQGSLWT